MSGKIKKDWKFWLNVATFVALAGLIIISRHQIVDAFKNFAQLNYVWLLTIIPLQLFNNFSYAKMYQANYRNIGEKVRLKTLFLTAFELNFVNHVFPSGGVSGFSYISLRLKREGVSTAKSTLVQILRFALTFMSFLAILFVGMIFLTFGGRTNRFLILLSTSIVLLTIFGSFVAVYIIGDEGRIKAFTSFLPRVLNKIGRHFRRAGTNIIDIPKLENTMQDLHDDYVFLSKDWSRLKVPFIWALCINLSDLATVYVVYLAFGAAVNPGAVIIAYAVANFAGLVAVLPGGVGVYEGLMTATMASAGVNKGLALSATVIYRVLYMLLFLPPGYILYQRVLKRSGGTLEPAEVLEEVQHVDLASLNEMNDEEIKDMTDEPSMVNDAETADDLDSTDEPDVEIEQMPDIPESEEKWHEGIEDPYSEPIEPAEKKETKRHAPRTHAD